jgi:hypothetical protein
MLSPALCNPGEQWRNDGGRQNAGMTTGKDSISALTKCFIVLPHGTLADTTQYLANDRERNRWGVVLMQYPHCMEDFFSPCRRLPKALIELEALDSLVL